MEFFKLLLALFQSLFSRNKNVNPNSIPSIDECKDDCDLQERERGVVILPALPEVPAPKEHKEKKGERRFCWLLDAGHGALQKGKRSAVLNGEQFIEWEWNFDIVRRISEGLKALNINHVIINDNPLDKGSWLSGRIEKANRHKSNLPKIFVSVHANAWLNKYKSNEKFNLTGGIETWFFVNSKIGKRLASVFQKHLVKANPTWRDRGIKFYENLKDTFRVLKDTRMPSVVTESGFYTNKIEMKRLNSEEGRQAAAQAHIDAIIEIEKEGI